MTELQPDKPSKPKSRVELLKRVETLVCEGQSHTIFGQGTGAPGKTLEYLLGVDGGNNKVSDGAGIECKYHHPGSLITLLHREGSLIDLFGCALKARSGMAVMVARYSYLGRNGRQNFRHTVRGSSTLFVVQTVGTKIHLLPKQGTFGDVGLCWEGEDLYQDVVGKLRYTVLVGGSVAGGQVTYDHARYFQGLLNLEGFLNALMLGVIAIDMDACLNERGGLRNHGTKFRIHDDDLSKLWKKLSCFDTISRKWTPPLHP